MSNSDPSSVPLTVVVTCFNRAKYLGPALESVLRSTYSSFKLLVLDDASTDDSFDIARRYADRDSRIEVRRNERNLGQFGNRNLAIEMVDTPLLKFHDSDDLMYPHCLEVMMHFLEAEPEAAFALSSGRSWSGGACPMLLTPQMAYEREYFGDGLFFCGPSGALFRTGVFRELGGFPDCGVASDYCFWLKACSRVNCVLVPADLFWYRIHPGQEFRSPRAQQDYAVAQGKAWQALTAEDCPLGGAELERAKRSCTHRFLRLAWRDLLTGRWRLIGLRMRSAGLGLADWVRYPPSRFKNPLAGTPLDEKGAYATPRWVFGGASKNPRAR